MKSPNKILVMLVSELLSHLDKLKAIKPGTLYFNEMLGDTSFLLAGLLESLLKANFSEWDKKKWVDDSLITNVILQNNRLVLDGVMIWGKMDTTEQWTEPFSFDIVFLKEEENFKEFTFMFGDLTNSEISYEEFRDNRDYWVKTGRKWKYVINSDEVLM